jgi:hypothetical protein
MFNNDTRRHVLSSLNEQVAIYRTQCSCNSHYSKQLIEQIYALPVDRLFDLIFGSNDFVRTYRQAQNFFGEFSLFEQILK